MTEGKRILRSGVDVPVIDNFDGEYAFLSNFYPSTVRLLVGSIPMDFPTVEHAYQAAKTLDPKEREWIRSAKTPGEAKRRGRDIVLRSGWNNQRLFTMRGLLLQKFQEEPLRQMLIDTGNAELIEGNTWHDVFWGDCRCDHHRGQGGLNHLGRLLMSEREAIREGA